MNEKLWCTVGQHYFGRKLKPGRKPTVCDEHKTAAPKGTTVTNPMPVEKRLEKAREVKTEKKVSALWERVERSAQRNGCRCNLRPGMSKQELRELGVGCTENFICPALDTYRRLQ